MFSDWVWIFLTALCVSSTLNILGYYLMLRKETLVGDALGHAVLPGVVLVYLFLGDIKYGAIFVGAIVAGLLSTYCISFFRRKAYLFPDSALGITSLSFFSLGVFLLSFFGRHIDIDLDCVLFGEILLLPISERLSFFSYEIPVDFSNNLFASILCLLFRKFFHHHWLASAFNSLSLFSIRKRLNQADFILMTLTATSIVFALKTVGIILVLGFLAIPSAFARVFTNDHRQMLIFSMSFSILSLTISLPLSYWSNLNLASVLICSQFVIFLSSFMIQKIFSRRAYERLAKKNQPSFRSSH